MGGQAIYLPPRAFSDFACSVHIHTAHSGGPHGQGLAQPQGGALQRGLCATSLSQLEPQEGLPGSGGCSHGLSELVYCYSLYPQDPDRFHLPGDEKNFEKA